MSGRSRTVDTSTREAPSRAMSHWREYRYWISVVVLAASDVVAFALAALLFRNGRITPQLVFLPGLLASHAPIDIFYILGFFFIMTRYIFGDYSRRRPVWDGARSTTISVIVVSVPCFLILLTFPGRYSSFAAFGSWGFLLFAIPFLRQLSRVVMARANIWRLPTALIASAARANNVYAALNNTLSLGYDIRYLVLEEESQACPENLRQLKRLFLTDPDDIATKLAANGCDQAVVATEDVQSLNFANLIQRLMEVGINVSVAPSFRLLPFVGAAPSCFLGRDLLLFQVRNNLRRFPTRFVKRGFDILGSFTAIVLLTPVFLTIALLLKLKHPSVPLLFGQNVVGKTGRQFVIWKFSTMAPNAHLLLEQILQENDALRHEWNQTFKLKNDPRILPGIGDFLRRSSLNELPQFFNVLIGDMSLVGPRPVVQRELTQYYGSAAQLYTRVRPGITGLWQISGRSDTTYEERVMYDEWYILNWSFWYDVVIILQTAWIVLSGKGAY